MISVDMPQDIEQLQHLIESAFLELTGRPMSLDETIHVEDFVHGGMSSGAICTDFWRERALPLLFKRFEQSR
ncbi:hypothetical protein [Shewanella maritima]|uniref:hypothetical protein n=1 Tax=Shewanella maritima TaxID=2520507 RepID=UPI001A9123BF|nr:hypothetical protein [Shewanella maritima]